MYKINLLLSQECLVKFFRSMCQTSSAVREGPSKSKTVISNRMKAWQIHSYGDLNELQLYEGVRMPIITSSTEVLVKVHAASVNPIDLMMMQGYAKTMAGFLRNYDLEFPLTLGRDFCGRILDKGQDVHKDFKIGDLVYGVLPIHLPGSHAQAIIAEQSLICHKPKHLNEVEAASLLYAALTAWSALYITGELCLMDPKKTRVLVLGASGGVGSLAVQILKAQQATVIGTCSTNALTLVKALGADSAHDYSDINFIKNVGDDGSYDIILDCAQFGHEKVPLTWKYTKFITLNSPLVKNTDKYGLVGGLATSAAQIVINNIPVCVQGKTVRWGFFAPFANGVHFIDNLVKSGAVNPVIHQIFKFDEVPLAFETLEYGHLRGKIVIDFQ